MVKFYTLPPIPWRWVLINAHKPNLSYIRRHWKTIESVIIDSGVEIFRDPKVKDYPDGWIGRLIGIYNAVRTYVKTAWVTVPDYPDDYHPKALWIGDKTNIERTIDNIVRVLDSYPDVNWLIPIQGHNKAPHSIAQSIRYLDELGVLDNRDYYAIANLCVEPQTALIVKTVSLARSLLPNKKLHVFGVKLRALRFIGHLIDSFDSFAWTRPVKTRGHSAKTSQERLAYFMDWLKRLEEILPKNHDLLSFGDHG